MKTVIAFFLISILTLHAEDFTAKDGKVYKNFKVLSHDEGFITILYADGGGKIALSNLPEGMQKQYGYNAAKCAALVDATTEADRRDRLAVAQAQTAAQIEKSRAQASPHPVIITTAYKAPRDSAAQPQAPSAPEADAITQAKKDDARERIKYLQDDIASLQKQQGRNGASHSDHPNYSGGGLSGKIASDQQEIQDLQASL